MGRIINGLCRQCGYRTIDLYFGSGRTDPNTRCQFPVLDKENQEVKIRDISLRVELTDNDDNIVFYNDASLSRESEDDQPMYIEWGDYRLKSCNNYCPKCHKNLMEFTVSGLWD